MKILSVEIIEFGGLKDLTLDFSADLNIITGRNESGKSTVLLFILYMLYGLPKSSRKNTPSAFDKERSLSWDGGRAEGKIELICDGKRISIYRMNANRLSRCRIIDVESGKELIFSKEVGEELLGISRECFESCCWCGQLRSSSIDAEHVSHSLVNISVSGDENINAAKALSRLREARKEYRLERGSGGKIHRLDGEIANLRAEYAQLGFDLENSNRDRRELESWQDRLVEAEARLDLASRTRDASDTLRTLSDFSELDRLNEKCKRLEGDLATLEGSMTKNGKTPAEQDCEELRFLAKNYTQRKDELASLESENIYASRVSEESIELAERIIKEGEPEQIRKDVAGADSEVKKRKKLGLILGASGIGALVLGAVLAAFGSIVALVIFALTGLAALTLGVLSFIDSKKRESELFAVLERLGIDAEGAEQKIADALAQYEIYLEEKKRADEASQRINGMRSNLAFAEGEIKKKLAKLHISPEGELISQLHSLIAKISQYLTSKKELSGELSVVRTLCNRKELELRTYDREALKASLPADISSREDIDLTRLEADFKNALVTVNNVKDKIHQIMLSLEASKPKIERRRELEDQISVKEKLLEDYKREFYVLDLAYTSLEKANNNQKQNFAPKIRTKAGELLARISDGKYSGVLVDEEFNVSVEQKGAPRASGALSGGTADALYLALRMSLIDTIFEAGAPLFLDESLSQLDDTRAENVLKLVHDFVNNGNQCLLFSCHNREINICSSASIPYNCIEL